MRNCIPDKLGFDFLERSHLTGVVEQGQRVEQRRRLCGDKPFGGRGSSWIFLTRARFRGEFTFFQLRDLGQILLQQILSK